jgi:hypothetical protein
MPIRTYFPDGSLMFDSDTAEGGLCVGLYSIPAGSSFSKSWPQLAGATLVVCSDAGRIVPLPSVGGSVPTLTLSPSSVDRCYMVWALGLPAILNGPGITAQAGDGNLSLVTGGRGLNYIGRASYVGTVERPSSGAIRTSAYKIVRVTSATQPVGIVDLSSGCSVQSSPAFRNVGGNTWEGRLVACATAPTAFGVPPAAADLLEPVIQCFAVPAAPGLGTQFALYDDDLSLAYDLLAGRLLTCAQMVSYAAGDLVPTLGHSVSTVGGSLGLFGSASVRIESARGTASSTWSTGFWRRSGSTLYLERGVTEYEIDSIPPDSPIFRFNNGARVLLVDLAGLP